MRFLTALLFGLLLPLGAQGQSLPNPAFGPNTSVGGVVILPELGLGMPTFDTLAQFQASTAFASTTNYAFVRAIAGTYPPPAGQDATSLLYRRVSSATGLYGEQTIAGVIWDPVYSTHPVKTSEFGDVGDAGQAVTAGLITATSNGTATLTTSNTTGVSVGANIGSVNWHSLSAAGSVIVPPGAVVVSYVPNASITLSATVPAASNLSLYVEKIVTTGTDDTNAIQQAINFALKNNYPDVQIANGKHLTSDVLNAGWGNGFYELGLIGNSRSAFSGTAAGVTILPTKTDRPALNYQGMRNGKCDGVTLYGLNANWVYNTQVFNYKLSSDPADWVAPWLYTTSGPGGLQKNAPLAGITVDAYSGTAPAVPYPNRIYPAWTGLTAQYGGAFSSNMDASGCEVWGFGVDYVVGLNTSSQGDFMRAPSAGGAAAYFATWSNSQARGNVLADADLQGMHTVVSNDNIGSGSGSGAQPGFLQGNFKNISFGETYQLANASLPNAGPLSFDDVYCEVCVRVGEFDDPTGRSAGVVFRNLDIEFATELHGQLPSALFVGNGRITLNNPSFTANSRIVPLSSGSLFLTINGGAINLSQPVVIAPSAADQQAIGYSGGAFAGLPAANTNLYNHFLIQTPYVATTYIGGSQGVRDFGDTIAFSTVNVGKLNRSPMTQGATKYVSSQGQQYQMAVPYPGLLQLTASTGAYNAVPSALSYSGDVVTFAYCSYYQTGLGNPSGLSIAPGDMLYAVNTSTLFVVETVSTPVTNSACNPTATSVTITAKQQNNITVNPSTEAWTSNTNPDPTLGGYTMLIKTGVVIPAELYWGTFGTNCAITGASRGDGYGGDISNYYAAGDIMFGLPFGNPTNPWPVNGNGGMTLGAITVGSPASTAAGTGSCTAGTFPIFPYALR